MGPIQVEALWAARAVESHAAEVMLWEGEPLPAIAERLKGLGIESVVFDPCGNAPGEAHDFLDVMQANVEGLETAFSRR